MKFDSLGSCRGNISLLDGLAVVWKMGAQWTRDKIENELEGVRSEVLNSLNST